MAVMVNDIWSFALEQELFGQQIINTFACKVLAVPAGTSEEAWLNNWFGQGTGYFEIASNLRDNIRQVQAPEIKHRFWKVQRVAGTPSNVFIIGSPGNEPGAHDGVCKAGNLAASVIRRGTLAGRRQRGRIAIAGVPDEVITNGELTLAYRVDCAQVGISMQGVKTRAAGDSVQMGFWSPAHEGIVNGETVLYAPLFIEVITTTVGTSVRVQRSRTVGVGS